MVDKTVDAPQVRSSKISRDVAIADFDRWADEWDIDTEKEHMDAEDRAGFENARAKFIRAICKGRLSVSEDAQIVVQHLEYTDSADLEYKVPTGAAFITLDHHKETQHMTKLHSYMASMTGKALKEFSKMDSRDIKVGYAVAQLFMGS